MQKLLVIDADADAQQIFRRIFDSPGLQITVSPSVTAALELLPAVHPDALIMNLELGVESVRRLREKDGRLPIIVIGSTEAIKTATEAIRLGAYSYLLKPFDTSQIQKALLSALEASRSMKEVLTFDATSGNGAASCWAGQSQGMRRVLEQIGRLENGCPVLITGEPGTGIRLIAQAVYQRSDREQQMLIRVDCDGIPETLLESELFGLERTDSAPFLINRIGRFEQCNGGTLLLHEISAASLSIQEKVVRAIAGGILQRIGGTEKVQVDVRLICTNRQCSTAGNELNGLHPSLLAMAGLAQIRLPSLREHKEDIRPLAKFFVEELSSDLLQRPKSLSAKALSLLEDHHWPGNVRELKEVIRKALLNSKGISLVPGDFPPHLQPSSTRHLNGQAHLQVSRKRPVKGEELAGLARKLFLWARTDSELKVIPAIERELVINALVETRGNQLHAARLLGITRATLRKRVAKFKIAQELSFG
ncbi:MAG TPA: sigma 54-interacting transcriptional regulator [Candidatus Eisenbacteria bacterium]|nr:sigma 54-interacting transcriptional regulator [Candidatus Eisenbacteria bacterium]